MKKDTVFVEEKSVIQFGGFKVCVDSVDDEGICIRVIKHFKSVKTYYYRFSRGSRGYRLSPNHSIYVIGKDKNGFVKLEVTFLDHEKIKNLNIQMSRLCFSRRRSEQIIINNGLAIITVMALDEKRCAVNVAYSGKTYQKYLVIGERPIKVIPDVTIEYVGFYAQVNGRLSVIAPRYMTVDRHEVHMKKEFNISTIEEKRTEYNVKRLDNNMGVKTA